MKQHNKYSFRSWSSSSKVRLIPVLASFESIASTLPNLNWLLVFGPKPTYKWSGCLVLADLYVKVELFTKEAKHEMKNKAACGYFLS
jgi:hypothetical protein